VRPPRAHAPVGQAVVPVFAALVHALNTRQSVRVPLRPLRLQVGKVVLLCHGLQLRFPRRLKDTMQHDVGAGRRHEVQVIARVPLLWVAEVQPRAKRVVVQVVAERVGGRILCVRVVQGRRRCEIDKRGRVSRRGKHVQIWEARRRCHSEARTESIEVELIVMPVPLRVQKGFELGDNAPVVRGHKRNLAFPEVHPFFHALLAAVDPVLVGAGVNRCIAAGHVTKE
jgi:hypothetical protein